MAILHHWQFDFNFYLICTFYTNIWLLIHHAIGLNIILIDLLKHAVAFLSVCAQAYPTKEFFAVAEKGNQPNIIVYEYPSLRPYRILKGKGDLEALSNFFFLVYSFECFTIISQVALNVLTALWILTSMEACWPVWEAHLTICWRSGIGGKSRCYWAARLFLRRSTEWPFPHMTWIRSHLQDLNTSSKTHPFKPF